MTAVGREHLPASGAAVLLVASVICCGAGPAAAAAAADHATAAPPVANGGGIDLAVIVEVRGCVSLSELAIRHVLEVETHGRVGGAAAPSSSGPGAPPGRLLVSCDGDRARLAAERSTGGRIAPADTGDGDGGSPEPVAEEPGMARRGPTRIERELSLAELPRETASRIVALAALELLATLEPTLLPIAPARPPVDGDATVPPRAPVPARWRLTGALVGRAFTADAGVRTWGGALAFERALGMRLGLGAAVNIERGARHLALGQATALLASVGVGAHIRAGDGRPVALLAEAGGRGGVARLAGATDRPGVAARAVVRPWAGPFAGLHGLVARGAFCARLSIEAGFAALAADGEADGTTALAVRGPWLAAALGAGVCL